MDGFSAGLVDDDNMLEWQIVIMGWVSSRSVSGVMELTHRPADTLYEGAILKARLIFPPVSRIAHSHGYPAYSQEYPLLPPKMVFDSEMWHPNGERRLGRRLVRRRPCEMWLTSVYNDKERKGEVCVSILVRCHCWGEMPD